MTKSEFENPKGFNLEDLERFVNILCERSLSAATQRSLIFQFRKIKKENEVLKQVVKDAFELARSAASIAGRQGYQTNWDAFESRVRSFIEITKELLEKEGVEL